MKSVLAGKIQPVISSFVLTRDDVHAIYRNVSGMLFAVDLAVLFIVGWLLVPSLGIVYTFVTGEKRYSIIKKSSSCSSVDSMDDGYYVKDIDEYFEGTKYQRSYIKFLADHLSQMARLALLVYACDCIVTVFHTIGYKAEEWSMVSKIFAKILYTSWLARRLQNFKSYLIRKALNRAPENHDKFHMINRLLDGMMYAVLIVKILDFLSVETGLALTSIFAVGTTGGLIVSLASQEIARGIVTGVEMAASDRFYEGDEVHFGDGTQGFIAKIGFLRTQVRKYDESICYIPNSQLGGQRVNNISRTEKCRVVTKLRFHYEDIPKLTRVCAAIKEEIKKVCPKLITGDKPFRAKISSFERDHVEVTVDCRFAMKPVGDEFWDNRENMFLAIDRGVRQYNVKYVEPIYTVQLAK